MSKMRQIYNIPWSGLAVTEYSLDDLISMRERTESVGAKFIFKHVEPHHRSHRRSKIELWRPVLQEEILLDGPAEDEEIHSRKVNSLKGKLGQATKWVNTYEKMLKTIEDPDIRRQLEESEEYMNRIDAHREAQRAYDLIKKIKAPPSVAAQRNQMQYDIDRIFLKKIIGMENLDRKYAICGSYSERDFEATRNW